ncbi:hypothetical protein J8137_04320 [Lactiplantibacillus plantarum]|nr:hypothetical protein [Lactiplantibacillus plantarum]
MKKQQVMSVLVAGLAVGLVGCGKAKPSQPTVAIYHQAKQGTQIWYEVPNHDKITKNTAINSIIVLKKNRLTQYYIGDEKKLEDISGKSNHEITESARKWEIARIKNTYENPYYGTINNQSSQYNETKSQVAQDKKKAKIKESQAINTYKVVAQNSNFTVFQKSNSSKVFRESLTFNSKEYENSKVRYDFISTTHSSSVNGYKFIGYLVTEHVDGASNTVDRKLVQQVSNKNKVTSFDSVKEPGITVKKTEN